MHIGGNTSHIIFDYRSHGLALLSQLSLVEVMMADNIDDFREQLKGFRDKKRRSHARSAARQDVKVRVRRQRDFF